MDTVFHSSLLTTPLFTRVHEASMTMRRTLTARSAAVLLGIAALTGGCMDPADVGGQAELAEAELDELDELADAELDELDEDELDEAELDEAELDEAELDELAAEPRAVASCALLSGYIAGDPSPTFPDTVHPVVGYKLDNPLLQVDLLGQYLEYRIQLCNVSFSYTKTYHRYVFGPFAGSWVNPPEYGPV